MKPTNTTTTQDMIVNLHSILSRTKDFNAAYAENLPDEMIIQYNDKFYKVKLEEVTPPKITDELRTKYRCNNTTEVDDIIKMAELLEDLMD